MKTREHNMIIRVGLGSCGIAAGGRKVLDAIEKEKHKHGYDLVVEPTGCVGMCFYEPIMDVVTENNVYSYGYVDREKAIEILESHINYQQPKTEYLLY